MKGSSAVRLAICRSANRKRRIAGKGGKGETAVMSILQGWGEIRTVVVAKSSQVRFALRGEEACGARVALYTDALLSWGGLASEYAYKVTDQAVQDVSGRVHTKKEASVKKWEKSSDAKRLVEENGKDGN